MLEQSLRPTSLPLPSSPHWLPNTVHTLPVKPLDALRSAGLNADMARVPKAQARAVPLMRPNMALPGRDVHHT